MNTTQQAIYTLKQENLHPSTCKPITPKTDEAQRSAALRHTVDQLSASGKAVLRSHKELVRKTARLYHRVQRDLDAATVLKISKARSTRSAADASMPSASTPDTPSTDGLHYVPGWTAKTTLADGTGIIVRPLLDEDREGIEEGFERLSAESRYQRFMTSMETLPEHYVDYLTNVDYARDFAVIAAIEDPVRFELQGLGIARFITLDEPCDEAELAITILDETQGRGLGMLFMNILLRAAQERGLRALRAEVLPDNKGMQTLAAKWGGTKISAQDGYVTWRIPTPSKDALKDAPFNQYTLSEDNA